MSESGEFLVFNASCTVCSEIAEKVSEASDGQIQGVSHHDPLVLQTRTEGIDVPTDRPALISKQGSRTRVRSGSAMHRYLVRTLGPRRSWLVLKAVSGDAGQQLSRRGALRLGAAGALSLLGAGALAAPAAASTGELSARATEAQETALSADPAIKAKLKQARRLGFVTTESSHAFDYGDGTILTIWTFASRTDADNEAYVLMAKARKGGVSAEVAGGVSRRVALTTDVQARGVKAFASCVFGLTGATCGPRISYCANLRVWQLILSCLVGICGAAGARAAWQCRRLL